MIRQVMALGLLMVGAGIASAQDPSKIEATVKLIDPTMNKMLVAITKDGGIKIVEYDLGKEVKFLDDKGKPLKGGMKSDAFKSAGNRPSVPVTINLTPEGGVKSIKLQPPK